MKSSSLVLGLIFDFMSDSFWILEVFVFFFFLLLLFIEKGTLALGIMAKDAKNCLATQCLLPGSCYCAQDSVPLPFDIIFYVMKK